MEEKDGATGGEDIGGSGEDTGGSSMAGQGTAQWDGVTSASATNLLTTPSPLLPLNKLRLGHKGVAKFSTLEFLSHFL